MSLRIRPGDKTWFQGHHFLLRSDLSGQLLTLDVSQGAWHMTLPVRDDSIAHNGVIFPMIKHATAVGYIVYEVNLDALLRVIHEHQASAVA